MYDAYISIIPRQEEGFSLNILKLVLAKARKTKRVKNIKSSLNNKSTKESKKAKQERSNKYDEFVIIGSSMQGNERIATIDYRIKYMLDEWKIKNQIIFCGGGLSACSMREEEKIDQRVTTREGEINYSCISCNLREELQDADTSSSESTNIEHINYRDSFEHAAKDVSGLKSMMRRDNYKGVNIHEHAKSSTIRYLGRPLKKGEEVNDNQTKAIYAEYWKSACAIVDQWDHLITEQKPTRIILNHGLYVPQGIILEIAKKYKIPVSTWHLGYRKNTRSLHTKIHIIRH